LSTLRQLGLMIITTSISVGLSSLAFFIYWLMYCLRLSCSCVLEALFSLRGIHRILVL
jgi:hypothetical protein